MDERHATQQQVTEQIITSFPLCPATYRHRSGALAQTLLAVLVRGILLGSLLVVFAACSTGPVVPTLPSGGGWRAVSSPNPGLTQNGLYGVATVSANNVWAVGYSSNSGDTITHTLIQHWNGQQWSVVPGANPGLTSNVLKGITAVSAHDVWAVGFSSNTSISATPMPPNITINGTHALVEHWNGIQWSVVPNPNLGSTLNTLNAVAAISPDDVWAVGVSSNSPINPHTFASTSTLIEHWNGQQWNITPGPDTGDTLSALNGIAALSATDIWAVGYFCCRSDEPGLQPLVEHWNGKQWGIVQSPNIGYPRNVLNAVAADSAHDVWAVGSSYSSQYPNPTLIEHWNGQQWCIVSSPNNTKAYGNGLAGVTAIAANDVWVVGYSPSVYPQQGPTLIEHWNGKQWSIVQGPSPGQVNSNYLYGVARIPRSNQIWAVGFFGYNFTPERTITEVWG